MTQLPGSEDGDRRVLILARTQLETLLTFINVLPAVREGFIALWEERARAFPLIREQLATEAMFGLRSGVWEEHGLLGLKASGYFPENRSAGRDSHQASILLMSPLDGHLLAVVDGNHVTWIRTAVAGALGTLTLARHEARRILIVGNGLQAEAQALSHAWLLGDRKPTFAVHAPRDGSDGGKARAICQRLAARGIDGSPAPDLAAGALSADVIVTATPSRSPLLRKEWIRPGTHITAVGADSPGKAELDDNLLAAAFVVVDDPMQAARVGEAQRMSGSTLTSLGAILAGARPGRVNDEMITVFDSTGLAVHDIATAGVAFSAAANQGVGSRVSLE